MKPIFRIIEKEFEELKKFFPIIKRRPACDIIEKKDEILLIVDLPGFSKDEIEIEAGEDYVKIKAEKKEKEEKMEGKYVIKERNRNFYRYVELPYKIKQEEVKAKLKDGVLQIILPKERKLGKKIEVE